MRTEHEEVQVYIHPPRHVESQLLMQPYIQLPVHPVPHVPLQPPEHPLPHDEVQPDEQLVLHDEHPELVLDPLQELEQLEHPLDSDVPVHELVQVDAQYAVQSEQSSFVQLVSTGNALDMVRIPIIGIAFFAASLKNSRLFCKFLFFIGVIVY